MAFCEKPPKRVDLLKTSNFLCKVPCFRVLSQTMALYNYGNYGDDGEIDARSVGKSGRQSRNNVKQVFQHGQIHKKIAIQQRCPLLQRRTKKQRLTTQIEVEEDGDNSDAERLLRRNEPDVDSANEGHMSDTRVRLEHDALLQEISHDLEQEEEVGGTINQQLADIVNKRWSTKQSKKKKIFQTKQM